MTSNVGKRSHEYYQNLRNKQEEEKHLGGFRANNTLKTSSQTIYDMEGELQNTNQKGKQKQQHNAKNTYHNNNKNNKNNNNNNRYQVLTPTLYDTYFGSLKGRNLDEALGFAVFLDSMIESEHNSIFKEKEELFAMIHNGDVDCLQFINPSNKWKPKQYVNNYQEYWGAVLEMTGNALNRMGINAFNFVNEMNEEIKKESGDVAPKIAWMCCGEDANGAQIESILENIRHLRDLITGEAIYHFKSSKGLKTYKLNSKQIPPCSFRPRGLHCVDSSIARFSAISGQNEPIIASMLDVALWAKYVLPELLKREKLPLLYIPKMNLVREAALWHKILKVIEMDAHIEEGTIKVVFLAETFPAVFHVAGLIEAFEGRCIGVNCGRWDYLYSYVNILSSHKNLNIDGQVVNTALPPKHNVTTDVDLLKKYQIKVSQTCHHYNIQFIGGMNATLPSTHPDKSIREKENHKILQQTIQNKSKEKVFYGAGKTWVAHIGLLDVAKTLNKIKYDSPIDCNVKLLNVTRRDVFDAPSTPKYDINSFKKDVHVILLYMTRYLMNRNGAVAIDNMMEDMATAEISCSLNCYYLRHHLLDADIKKEGGLKQIIQNVANDVLHNKLLSELDPQDEDQKKRIKMIFEDVKQVLFRILSKPSDYVSLEMALYLLALVLEPSRESFSLIAQSSRFPRNAKAASIMVKPALSSKY